MLSALLKSLKGDMEARAVADEELVGRAQCGEQAAFAELMSRHAPSLYRFVYHLLNNHADTDDIVQETFVQAFRALPRFVPHGSFRMWLFTIATRRCTTLRRRAKNNVRPLEEVDLSQLVDEQHSAHDVLISRELQMRVRSAIAGLPSKQREAIVLFEIEGWKVADIAATLQCSPATVKVHLHRARNRLRKDLEMLIESEQKAEVSNHEMPKGQTAHPGMVE